MDEFATHYAKAMQPSMHPDAAAFHEAIKQNESDKTLALIYADWLEEHGNPAAARIIREHNVGADDSNYHAFNAYNDKTLFNVDSSSPDGAFYANLHKHNNLNFISLRQKNGNGSLAWIGRNTSPEEAAEQVGQLEAEGVKVHGHQHLTNSTASSNS